jgi:hypothetical protein
LPPSKKLLNFYCLFSCPSEEVIKTGIEPTTPSIVSSILQKLVETVETAVETAVEAAVEFTSTAAPILEQEALATPALSSTLSSTSTLTSTTDLNKETFSTTEIVLVAAGGFVLGSLALVSFYV